MGKGRKAMHGGRVTPKGYRPVGQRPVDRSSEPPLVDDARKRLREASPFGLMAMASGLVEATTPRPADRIGRGRERPDGPAAFQSFAASGLAPMGALALAVAALHPDDWLAARIRAAVNPAIAAGGPSWLASIGEIEITDTATQGDPTDTGENVCVSWRWRTGGDATAVVYVDHRIGTAAKDAFVIPDGAEEFFALAVDIDPLMQPSPISPADARGRIAEAIANYDELGLGRDTETWPACRPMIEWVLRHLPDGGRGYAGGPWEDVADDALDGALLGAVSRGDMDAVVALVERKGIALAGGQEAWERIDDSPLGDVAFDWSLVPATLRAPTAETLELLDRWAAELFDAEVRTIARVALSAVLTNDASVFKRSARADALAAAILSFLSARLSGRMAAKERRALGWKVTTAKQLAEATGVSSSTISARARTVTKVVEAADIDWSKVLHSSQRRELVRTREHVESWRAERN